MKLYVQPVRDVFQTNAYFYINENNGHGYLIDPGAQAELLLYLIKRYHWKIEAILLTHGHFDHVGAVDRLTRSLNIPYFIHRSGTKYLQNNELNLAQQNKRQIQIKQRPQLLQANDVLELEKIGLNLQVLHTPGHSFDSVTYYDEKNKVAFVGDVLYDNSPGIWQFPGGNKNELMATINQKLCALPADVHCFLGHTKPMTIKQVKRF